MKAISSLGAGALALALSFPALAAGLPQAKTEHGITYLSGGIGKDESQAMKAEQKNYPLSLVFAAGRRDEYLANVPVKIENRSGSTVLDTVSRGPIMLVKLPAGRYRVAATRRGKALQRIAVVKGRGDTQVVFHWPEA